MTAPTTFCIEQYNLALPTVSTPTTLVYQSLTQAFKFYNEKLFENGLPECLITLQRKNRTYGYFSGNRFNTRDGDEYTDEIALNPSHFRDRPIQDILSTLVHEMAHLEQFHFGTPSRSGYHNKEWGTMMKAVGLIPVPVMVFAEALLLKLS